MDHHDIPTDHASAHLHEEEEEEEEEEARGREHAHSADHGSLGEGRLIARAPAFTQISDDDFAVKFWPELKALLEALLQQDTGSLFRFSHEVYYRMVYNCVCQRHGARLFENMMELVRAHYTWAAAQILTIEDAPTILLSLKSLAERFKLASSAIIPVFHYLHRTYVSPQLDSELRTELLRCFKEAVLDNAPVHVHIFGALVTTRDTPFLLPPHVLEDICKIILSFSQEYATENPELFGRFLNILDGATNEAMLSEYILESQAFLEQNAALLGMISNPGGKRSRADAEEEEEEEYDYG